MLKIHEIYKSIQGESTFTGLPCVFVRLTGCNLRCTWCDTEHAFYEGSDMSLEAVTAAVDAFNTPLVEITGGEPLAQKDVHALMQRLLAKRYRVLLETGGSLSLEEVPAAVVKIMDLKCPGSGEVAKNHYDNLRLLNAEDEVKFVILDRNDYQWSKDILTEYGLADKTRILFSPVYDKLSLKQLAEWILTDNLPVRLQTQLHKVIWSKDAIGV